MCKKITTIFLFLSPVIFSMEQQCSEGQAKLILKNNNGEIIIPQQHPLCYSEYIQAKMRFGGRDVLDVVKFPPALDKAAVQELSDALKAYEHVVKDEPFQLGETIDLEVAFLTAQLAHHFLDTESNFRKTVRFFGRQSITLQEDISWLKNFGPKNDDCPKTDDILYQIDDTLYETAVVTALKEELVRRAKQFVLGGSIKTDCFTNSLYCSPDGSRFAIDDKLSICNMYNEDGEIIERIYVRDFYNKNNIFIFPENTENVDITQKKFFFKQDGSLGICIRFSSRTNIDEVVYHILEYKDGHINLDNIIRLPNKNYSFNTLLHVDAHRDMYVYNDKRLETKNGNAKIKMVEQVSGEPIFSKVYTCESRPSLLSYLGHNPQKNSQVHISQLKFCGPNLIIRDGYRSLKIFNIETNEMYELDVRNDFFEIALEGNCLVVVVDNSIGFFRRDVSTGRFYEFFCREKTNKKKMIERLAISPDGTFCALIKSKRKFRQAATLKILNIMDIAHAATTKPEVVLKEDFMIAHPLCSAVKFLNNETLLVLFDGEVKIFSFTSKSPGVELEELDLPALITLLQALCGAPVVKEELDPVEYVVNIFEKLFSS